uniref:NADH-ubiquinone oxidoreductase chain 1 n=1 Tax=Macracanthorhynchus hirudinaceus TaxID=1032456 RepID=K0J9V5_MACHR|nr:NADH dehydrogenase subunit 1 [Macracanthorhynchus hirudinaceus]CCA94494.2 NADH Dehydrogenase subunit 1 [Macracanthorhynchus hirudinaceus]
MRMVVSELVMLVAVLLLVAYFTMVERKVLGYGQLRKGPNKSLFMGLGQPLLDGVKLMMKSFVSLKNSDSGIYLYFPMLVFGVMMCLWVLSLSLFGMKGFPYFVYVFLLFVGFMVVVDFMLSVYSGSKFGAIGAMRGLAQMVSYEILMGLIVILVFMEGYCFEPNSMGLAVYHFPVLIIWWVVCVVESNRAPMDFMEGESELVSGFNVEYGSVLFAMLFLGEYGIMALYSVLSVYLFFSIEMSGLVVFMSLSLMMMFLWWRLTYPRYRYDLLMNMSWCVFLPVVLIIFISSTIMISL